MSVDLCLVLGIVDFLTVNVFMEDFGVLFVLPAPGCDSDGFCFVLGSCLSVDRLVVRLMDAVVGFVSVLCPLGVNAF